MLANATESANFEPENCGINGLTDYDDCQFAMPVLETLKLYLSSLFV
jgi:hypothetical protein